MATEESKKPTTATWGRWLPLLLVVVGAATFANNLDGPFVFDDDLAIIKNDSIRGLWPPWRVFQARPSSARGRPVGNLSLAVNYAIGGLNVRGYHVFNIAVHVLAALVLFGIVRRTLLCEKLAPRFGRAAPGIALVCALLWMVHPIQTECVNYLTQRFETIMGLFYFLTLYCVIRAAGPRRRWWYVAAIASCALGMGTKEVMVTAPLMVLLYERTFQFPSFRELLRRRWGLYAGLAATWSVLVVLAAAFPHEQSAGFSSGVSPLAYAGKQCFVVTDYLKHIAWPHPLVFDYGHSEFLPADGLWARGGVLAALLLAAAAALVLRPMLGLPAAWFFVVLAPTSSIVPLPTEVGAERRLYVPLAGLVVLAVLGVYLLLARASRVRAQGRAGAGGGAPRFAVRVGAVLAAVAAAAMIWATVRRNAEYHSGVSIWETAVQATPYNPRAHHYLGLEIAAAGGRTVEVLGKFNKACELDPNSARIRYNRGLAYCRLGQPERAIPDFTRAIELAPVQARNYHGRGAAHALLRQFEAAIEDFTRAVERNPGYTPAYCARGEVYRITGRTDRAIEDYDKAIRLTPSYGAAYVGRAICHFQKRRYDLAWSDVKRARRSGHEPPAGFIQALSRASGRSR